MELQPQGANPWFSAGQFTSGLFNYPFSPTAPPCVLPRVDILDTGAHIVYLFDLADADPDKLNLEISASEVLLKAPPASPQKYANATLLYQERPKGVYARLLIPPANVDLDNVSAEYRHGLLEVRFPKKQPPS